MASSYGVNYVDVMRRIQPPATTEHLGKFLNHRFQKHTSTMRSLTGNRMLQDGTMILESCYQTPSKLRSYAIVLQAHFAGVRAVWLGYFRLLASYRTQHAPAFRPYASHSSHSGPAPMDVDAFRRT